jgi:hypothetical protein
MSRSCAHCLGRLARSSRSTGTQAAGSRTKGSGAPWDTPARSAAGTSSYSLIHSRLGAVISFGTAGGMAVAKSRDYLETISHYCGLLDKL